MRLGGRWILITGASSGFGAAAAKAFAAEGCHLILGARRLEKLHAAANTAAAAGAASVHVHALDVGSTANVTAFANWAQTITPQVHALINNAGGAHGLEPLGAGSDEDWDAMVQSNLLGLARMTRAILPCLPKDSGAWILNIGSVAGHLAYENGAMYCAVKAGERKVTEALRLELNGTGIRVGTLDPGMAETEFSNVRFKGDEARAAKVYQGVHPLSAEDVAEAMVWMVSRPAHVCIDEMVIKPTDQAAVYKVYRRAPTS
jgi:NADP-dependent 3-hydroxy acid dehydrogenase YdfG